MSKLGPSISTVLQWIKAPHCAKTSAALARTVNKACRPLTEWRKTGANTGTEVKIDDADHAVKWSERASQTGIRFKEEGNNLINLHCKCGITYANNNTNINSRQRWDNGHGQCTIFLKPWGLGGGARSCLPRMLIRRMVSLVGDQQTNRTFHGSGEQ